MFKKLGSFAGALALGAMLVPAAALADDPHDPKMRDAGARARDRADTKKLNQGQLSYVRQRDAKTLQSYRQAQDENDRSYADAHADYERKMAAWRRAVAACNAGQTEYCDN